MTQVVDLVSTRAEEFAGELRRHLTERFGIAVRVRRLGGAAGHRVYQVRKPRNRHLVDVRPVDRLPATETMVNVQVLAPPDLIASKVIAYTRRRGSPKSGTDWRDIATLLLAFPALKTADGPVRDRLVAAGAEGPVLGPGSNWPGRRSRRTRTTPEGSRESRPPVADPCRAPAGSSR
jgi:hypothetical protein